MIPCAHLVEVWNEDEGTLRVACQKRNKMVSWQPKGGGTELQTYTHLDRCLTRRKRCVRLARNKDR
jgi:hypothetical protein